MLGLRSHMGFVLVGTMVGICAVPAVRRGGLSGIASVQAAQSPQLVLKRQFADLPGVHLWYIDTGNKGERGTVVFMHAGTGNSESWEPQLEVFSKAGYRGIAYDRRGWGKSTGDESTGPQPGTAADDLQALVEQLKIDKFHLVGLAAGAQVGIDYAAWHGERLLSMVLAGSLGPGGAEPELAEFTKRLTIPALNGPGDARYREVGPSFRGGNPAGYEHWLDIASHAQQAGARPQPSRSRNDYAKMETIRVRTLIMPGDADLLSPPAFMKLWGAHIKNAEWVLVPDSGHSINTEQPEAFNQDVLRFLKGEHFGKVPGKN